MRDGTGRRLRPATRASTTGSQGSRETRLVIAARDDDDAEALRALVVGITISFAASPPGTRAASTRPTTSSRRGWSAC